MITQAFLKEHLQYNLETGEFTWIKATSIQHNCILGSVAGSKRKDGYLAIQFK